ncbi:MAG: LytTR family DNA-binding domain-containing protein [Pseudomonadota bacterium]|nr:LytTR family DNA-binding domain-containing protein [Pseudomonadota bacterium]
MKILVCDDEPLARERLSRMVQEAGHTVVAQATNGIEALEAVKVYQPDVLFLDVRMPEMDGLRCAEALMRLENPPAVIFVTAFDQHAIDAFRTQAIGYLLKPVSREDLQSALGRANRLNAAQVNHLRVLENPSAQPLRQHIAARTHRGMELIPIENIYYFLADQKYVTVRHAGGQVLIDETLKELETEFGDRFIRIHRNALLAIPYLEGLEMVSTGQYQVLFRGINERLAVSRRHLPQLRDKMHTL